MQGRGRRPPRPAGEERHDHQRRFRGSITALVTPFRDGALDEEAFRAHVTGRSRTARHGLVPVGTTGESPTLVHDEHKRVVEICIEAAKGRVPVIAGAGSNNTTEAIDLAPHAEKAGADARARRHALLQQADPGRALPALQGGQRRDRHPDHHLQHPAALGDRHDASRRWRGSSSCKNIVGVKDATARSTARQPAAPRDGAGVHPALRRGRDRARPSWPHGGARLHLGHRQRRAAALRRVAGGLPRRRLRRGARVPGSPDAAARGDLHRAGPSPAPSTRLSLLGSMRREVRLPLRHGDAARRRRRSARPWCMPA